MLKTKVDSEIMNSKVLEIKKTKVVEKDNLLFFDISACDSSSVKYTLQFYLTVSKKEFMESSVYLSDFVNDDSIVFKKNKDIDLSESININIIKFIDSYNLYFFYMDEDKTLGSGVVTFNL